MATSLPIRIKFEDVPGKPRAVFVVQALDGNKQGQAVGIPGWDWDGQGNVVIRSIPTLPTGTYSITFLAIGG